MINKIVINQGVKVYYKFKSGVGLPLIFLHGAGGSMSAWNLMMKNLKKINNPFAVVDLRGFGLSSRPKDIEEYFLEKHIFDINQIIQKEKWSKVILIGHCFGSMIASIYASRFPEKIEKLILINIGIKMPWYIDNFFILPIIKTTAYFLIWLNKREKGMTRVDYQKYQGTSEFNLFRLLADLKATGITTIGKHMLAVLEWDGRKYFPNIKAPVLIIAGEKDLIFSKRQVRLVKKLINRVKVEFVNSNHISIINSPNEVFGKIEDFLKRKTI